MHIWTPISWLLLVVAITTVGCGGGSGLVWKDFDRSYVSIDARDGFITSIGSVSTTGTGLIVGDSDGSFNGIHSRVVYSFETSGISSDAEIQSAVLRVYQESVDGTPYADLGALLVDHVDLGAALDAADFDGNTVTTNIGTLSSSNAMGWMTLDVTTAVQVDVSTGRAYSEFRLYFPTGSDVDGVSDRSLVNDGADVLASGQLPVLEVSYRAPRL